MCLGPEFFDQREEAVRTREAAGEIEVEHFMRSKRLRLGLLTELGYLDDDRETISTADLFVYRVPKEAKVFFSEDGDLQLIFVRAGVALKLASRLRAKVRAADPEIA
jgi:hypothetical protein